MEPFWKKFQINSFTKLGLVGLIICIANPQCFNPNYPAFLMSFIGCSCVYYVIAFKFNNKLVNSLIINILCFIMMIPFVVHMNHEISILIFINGFVFSYIFSFIFLYFLIFAWMPFMAIIHFGIISFAYIMIGNVSFTNIYIYMKDWKSYWYCLYYIISSSICVGGHYIVRYNKL